MFLPVRISKSSEALEVSTSEKEELRGRDPTQVKDAQLMQHLTEVNTLSEMLVTFISGTLSLVYFPAQNSTPLAFGENQPVSGKLQGRTELNLTSVIAADSFL
jgi:hypothetical protein